MEPRFDAVSEAGSTADWVDIHASPQSPRDLEADSQSLPDSESLDQLLVAPGDYHIPAHGTPQVLGLDFGLSPAMFTVRNQIPELDEISSTGVTESSSLDIVCTESESQRTDLLESSGTSSGRSDGLYARPLLEAIQPQDMEVALNAVWEESGRKFVTEKGRIINLSPDEIVLKAKDILQRLMALLCRDVGRTEGKQAAADFIAWMCADPPCARALRKPAKIMSTLLGLVNEDHSEIRRNVLRAIRNLVQQSDIYAKVLAAPERLALLVAMPGLNDATVCVYFSQTVDSLARRCCSEEESRRIGDMCTTPILQMLSLPSEGVVMAAVFDAVNSLSKQPHTARLICRSPHIKSAYTVLAWDDESIQSAAVELLTLLLQGEQGQGRLWEELVNENCLLGLFNLLKIGQTRIEVSVLKLLSRHPNLADTGLIGHPQLAAIESILQHGNVSCQEHAMAVLTKMVGDGLPVSLFVAKDVHIVCTLIGLIIGNNQLVKRLALETLKQLVERESGSEVTDIAIHYDGIGVIKYLLQEKGPESMVSVGPLVVLLWAVSRVDGGKSLVREAGIIPLLVEKLRSPRHRLKVLDCLHHFLVEDPENVRVLIAPQDTQVCDCADVPILRAISDMLLKIDCSSFNEARTHPLEVLVLFTSSTEGCPRICEEHKNNWINVLLGFASDTSQLVKELALQCMKDMVDMKSPLRLTLTESSLRFVADLLVKGSEDRLFGLFILLGLTKCSGTTVLEEAGIYSALSAVLLESAETKGTDLRAMALKAVAQVASIDYALCATEIVGRHAQEALWKISKDCLTDLSVAQIKAVFLVLSEVRKQEIGTGFDYSRDLHCLALEHRLQQKQSKIALLEQKLDEQSEAIRQQEEFELMQAKEFEFCQSTIAERDHFAKMVARLQEELKSKNERVKDYESEQEEQQKGVKALVDLVEQQYDIIQDLSNL